MPTVLASAGGWAGRTHPAAGRCGRREVVDDRLAGRLGLLAELLGALVAPVGLVALDVEFLDLAGVRAALAGELPQRVIDQRQVVAAEAAVGLTSGSTLSPSVPMASSTRSATGTYSPIFLPASAVGGAVGRGGLAEHHLVPRQQGGADRADHAVVRRDDDLPCRTRPRMPRRPNRCRPCRPGRRCSRRSSGPRTTRLM